MLSSHAANVLPSNHNLLAWSMHWEHAPCVLYGLTVLAYCCIRCCWMQASLPHRSQPKEMMPRRPYALLSHTEQFGLTPLYKDDAAIAKSRERVRLLRTSGNLSSSHAEALDQRDLQNTGWYEQTYKWLPEHDGQSSFFESVSKLYWSQNGLQATS